MLLTLYWSERTAPSLFRNVSEARFCLQFPLKHNYNFSSTRILYRNQEACKTIFIVFLSWGSDVIYGRSTYLSYTLSSRTLIWFDSALSDRNVIYELTWKPKEDYGDHGPNWNAIEVLSKQKPRRTCGRADVWNLLERSCKNRYSKFCKTMIREYSLQLMGLSF
jgi:hypothetical protein